MSSSAPAARYTVDASAIAKPETFALGDDADDERRAAAAGEPAHGIHEAGGRATRFRAHDVEHRREDIRIIEPLKSPQNVSAAMTMPTDGVSAHSATNGAPPTTPII